VNHETSEIPSATALEHKLDEKEEVKNMEKERIEAETRRLQEDQQAVMLARLEEEKQERDKISQGDGGVGAQEKLEEKRKSQSRHIQAVDQAETQERGDRPNDPCFVD
jgi:hypothetical protein